jgi:ATP/maltotriose-dependent transcriptional regulator MalT
MEALEETRRGRESYRRRAWCDAYESLALADRASPLACEDLELLASSAYLIGREDDFLSALDRAHHLYRDAGDADRAARCAFWLGLVLLLRGETGSSTGWLARAERLLAGRDSPEHGYLMLPVAEQQLASGDVDRAHSTASEAVAIGERFGEGDLIACARHVQGRALILQGRVEAGLALLDEAMVSVVAGELSPLFTGLIYCSVIEACQQVYALDRASEWTSALAKWCGQQPQMVAFTGTCLVHRAEIMQLHGAWPDAIEEARRACNRSSQGIAPKPPAAAFYQQGEVHRLRGDFPAAEEAYRSASQRGWEPQPGLALLRMAQGRTDTAAAAMRRVVSTTDEPLQRARLLPAHIEVLLTVSDLSGARDACRQLEEIAEKFGTGALRAMAAQARGMVELAEGDARAALGSLRRALQVWQQVEAPYLAARVRALMALVFRALGDEEGAELEFAAAGEVFQQLGAAPDLARLDSAAARSSSARTGGLTARELQVLRLIATGETNKAIAARLFLSEKTIERHVSNIFTKLDVPSRAAATAYAYEHKLI